MVLLLQINSHHDQMTCDVALLVTTVDHLIHDPLPKHRSKREKERVRVEMAGGERHIGGKRVILFQGHWPQMEKINNSISHQRIGETAEEIIVVNNNNAQHYVCVVRPSPLEVLLNFQTSRTHSHSHEQVAVGSEGYDITLSHTHIN